MLRLTSVGSVGTQLLLPHRVKAFGAEKVSDKRLVHFVARGIAFAVTVALDSKVAEASANSRAGIEAVAVPATFNLAECDVDVQLVYDVADESVFLGDGKGQQQDPEDAVRPVSDVFGAPLSFSVEVAENGSTATFATRIHVLSSQFEGAFFRLQMVFSPSETSASQKKARAQREPLVLYSQAIKVTAKRGQIRKNIARARDHGASVTEEVADKVSPPPLKRQRTSSAPAQAGPESPIGTVSPTTATSPPPGVTDDSHNLSEMVQQLLTQQGEQEDLIAKLRDELGSAETIPKSATSSSGDDAGDSSSGDDDEEEDFARSLKSLLDAWVTMPQRAKEAKLRELATSDAEGRDESARALLTALMSAMKTPEVAEGEIEVFSSF